MYKFLLRRRIKRIINHLNRKKSYNNIEEIRSVLILFDTKDFEDVSLFIQKLARMEKRIKAYAFKDKRNAAGNYDISCTILTDKDGNNKSLNQIVTGLSNETFDLVVDFSLMENLLLLYILAAIDSPLKAGLYRHAFSVHDIVIVSDPGLGRNVKELGNQLFHFLTIMSSGTASGGE